MSTTPARPGPDGERPEKTDAMNDETAAPASRKPRERARSEAAKQERREALLAAALKLFSLHGWAGTRIEAIAAEAGLSPAAFYLYFGSKLEIYRELTAIAASLLGAAIGEAAARPAASARERLEAIAAAYAAFFRDRREWFDIAEVLHIGGREFFAETGSAPELEARARDILAHVRDTVAEGMVRGELAPADPWETAVALWSMLDGVLLLEVKRGTAFTSVPLDRAVRRALDIIMAGLAAAPPQHD